MRGTSRTLLDAGDEQWTNKFVLISVFGDYGCWSFGDQSHNRKTKINANCCGMNDSSLELRTHFTIASRIQHPNPMYAETVPPFLARWYCKKDYPTEGIRNWRHRHRHVHFQARDDDEDYHFLFLLLNVRWTEFSDGQLIEKVKVEGSEPASWERKWKSFSIGNSSHLIGFDINCRRTSSLHAIKLLSKA